MTLYLAKAVDVLTASSNWRGYLSHEAAHRGPDDSLSLKLFLSKSLMPFHMVILCAFISSHKLSCIAITFIITNYIHSGPHLNRNLISRKQVRVWKHKVGEEIGRQKLEPLLFPSADTSRCLLIPSRHLPLHKSV